MIPIFIGCKKTKTINSALVKVSIIGDIYVGDWIQVNDYRIEFVLPDTTKAISFTAYNPYVLKISRDDNKIGLVCPTVTYDAGANKPVKKQITKGMMLFNIGKILSKLSITEYGFSIFNFRTDNVTIISGLLIFGLKNGEQVKVVHPQSMNILIEPYEAKE